MIKCTLHLSSPISWDEDGALEIVLFIDRFSLNFTSFFLQFFKSQGTSWQILTVMTGLYFIMS